MLTTGIVVLNWQSPHETIACIESLLQNIIFSGYQIIVVDNNSKDDSPKTIQKYLSTLSYNVVVIKHGKNTGFSNTIVPKGNESIILILSDHNGGYGYGNNLGLKISNEMGHKYSWILNNDCILKNDALSPMIKTARTEGSKLVGSVIMKSSGSIECYGGGKIYPALGRTKLLKSKSDFMTSTSTYLMGASLLIDMDATREIGYISEEYFMYFEELDWQWRYVGSGNIFSVSDSSLIFHKSGDKIRGKTYYYYKARSSVIFIHRFYGATYLPSALSFMILSESLQNLFRPKVFFWIMQGAISGLSYVLKTPRKSRMANESGSFS